MILKGEENYRWENKCKVLDRMDRNSIRMELPYDLPVYVGQAWPPFADSVRFTGTHNVWLALIAGVIMTTIVWYNSSFWMSQKPQTG